MTYLCDSDERFERWLESEKQAGHITRWKKLWEGFYIVEHVLHNYNEQLARAAGYFEWPF